MVTVGSTVSRRAWELAVVAAPSSLDTSAVRVTVPSTKAAMSPAAKVQDHVLPAPTLQVSWCVVAAESVITTVTVHAPPEQSVRASVAHPVTVKPFVSASSSLM